MQTRLSELPGGFAPESDLVGKVYQVSQASPLVQSWGMKPVSAEQESQKHPARR